MKNPSNKDKRGRGGYNSDGFVVAVAAASRILIGFAMVAADVVLVDHDARGVARFPSSGRGGGDGGSCAPVAWWLQAFTKWDSAHFLNIAANGGYKQESDVAFLPLYPSVVRFVADLFVVGEGSCRRNDLVVVVALCINLVCFVFSSLVFVRLLEEWKLSPAVQKMAFWVHIGNPANVFFTTAYTESIYAASSWLSMLLLERHRPLWACLTFLVASSIRSNGVLNAAIPACMLCRSLLASNPSPANVARFFFACAAPLLPFLLLDSWNHAFLCSTSASYKQEWASRCVSALHGYFGTYAQIQRKYWNVGFLKYYTLKQVPNILVALPISMIACATLILLRNEPLLLKYRVHLGVVLCTGACFAHTEILTRLLLASCPIVHVGLASLLLQTKRTEILLPVLSSYLVIFNILGVLLHSNFYPWT